MIAIDTAVSKCLVVIQSYKKLNNYLYSVCSTVFLTSLPAKNSQAVRLLQDWALCYRDN